MKSKEVKEAISNMKKYIEAPKLEQVDVRAGYNILRTKHKLIKEKDLIIVLSYIETLEQLPNRIRDNIEELEEEKRSIIKIHESSRKYTGDIELNNKLKLINAQIQVLKIIKGE